MRAAAASIVFAIVASFAMTEAAAQQLSPRDLWPGAVHAAREGDVDGATRQTADMMEMGRGYGIRTYPAFAASAAAFAREADAQGQADVVAWAEQTADRLDPFSPFVALSNADRAAAKKSYAKALPLAVKGIVRTLTGYRTSLLARADLLMVGALAIALVAAVFAVCLFIRYGRSIAHDFRELAGMRVSGGAVTVIAFALMFLPLFLWLGPMWLIFYWFAIAFAYASVGERVAIVLVLILLSLAPMAVDTAAHWTAAVDSPVMVAAISSAQQAYEPEALRRMQELVSAEQNEPMLHLLLGNLQAFEGNDEQAAVHYRRAIELRKEFAGARVNLGNLHFFNNEYQAAINQYEEAQRLAPTLALAFYNSSVASGETYRFDQQAQMLERARKADSAFVTRVTRLQQSGQAKVVMYHPSIPESWVVARAVTRRPAAASLFANYSSYEPARSFANPVSIGALGAVVAALILWAIRRRSGVAGACIKCGRTFCYRCKSARESATYCTQCIHIYLKRDGVSLDTKRKKLEEVSEYHQRTLKRNRLFATVLPGAAQLIEGRTASGLIGAFLFAAAIAVAIFVGRLAPALGPASQTAQLLIRSAAIAIGVLVWIFMSLPVYRRRTVTV